MKPVGIVSHVALRAADIGGEQLQELFDDIGRTVAVRGGGIAPGMELKDVIDHRQAEASHHFPVKKPFPVGKAVPQPVEVFQDIRRLLRRKMDDGILVQGDTASDAVVVGGQQVLEEFVVGREPLYLQVGVSGKVAHPVGHRDDDKVVLHNVVALLVEHETAFAGGAKKVQASVAEFLRIRRVKIIGIQEINLLHGTNIATNSRNCANRENFSAFCETLV